MTWKPDIFIYHDPCDDGFGAAWAVWQRWGDAVEYIPAAYGKDAPIVEGKNVLIGDFSYPNNVLEGMGNEARSVVILDHHKSADEGYAAPPFFRMLSGDGGPITHLHVEECLAMRGEGEPPVLAYFNMEKSGARLVWEFCHPEAVGDMAPDLVKYVEDRDLWRFKLPASRAFTLYLKSMPRDFSTWSDIDSDLVYRETRERLLVEARAIERFYDRQVRRILRGIHTIRVRGLNVPAVNCIGEYASDVGNAILAADPGAPFAVTYYDKGDGTRSFSLRSEDHRMDVSAIAKRYGGGGHRNAAGFEVPAP